MIDFRYMYSFRKEQKYSEDFIERQYIQNSIIKKNYWIIKIPIILFSTRIDTHSSI